MNPSYKIDMAFKPFRLTPNYKTGPRSEQCIKNNCTQCRKCLHPEPKEHFKLVSISRYGNFRNKTPGEYIETVEYSNGNLDFYKYIPSYI